VAKAVPIPWNNPPSAERAADLAMWCGHAIKRLLPELAHRRMFAHHYPFGDPNVRAEMVGLVTHLANLGLGESIRRIDIDKVWSAKDAIAELAEIKGAAEAVVAESAKSHGPTIEKFDEADVEILRAIGAAKMRLTKEKLAEALGLNQPHGGLGKRLKRLQEAAYIRSGRGTGYVLLEKGKERLRDG
jgi:hypothetical protein